MRWPGSYNKEFSIVGNLVPRIVATLLISIILFGAFFLLAMNRIEQRSQKNLAENLQTLMNISLSHELRFFDVAQLPEIAGILSSMSPFEHVQIKDRFGRIYKEGSAIIPTREADNYFIISDKDGTKLGSAYIWHSNKDIFSPNNLSPIVYYMTPIVLFGMVIVMYLCARYLYHYVVQPLRNFTVYVESDHEEGAFYCQKKNNGSTEFIKLERAFNNIKRNWIKAHRKNEDILLDLKVQARMIERILDKAKLTVFVQDARWRGNRGDFIGTKLPDDLENIFRNSSFDIPTGLSNAGYVSVKRIMGQRNTASTSSNLICGDVRGPNGDIWNFLPIADLSPDINAVLIENVTEIRTIEQEQMVRQRLDSVGTLYSGIAHDFNNVLTIVNGNLELILDDSNQPHHLEELLAIQQATKRAGTFINQLLNMTRDDISDAENVDHVNIIKNLSSVLPATLGPKIKLEIDLQAPPMLWCEADNFETSIINLAINARDAMPNGGIFRISSRTLKQIEKKCLRELSPDIEYCAIDIADTGSGISQEVLPKIFDPFYTSKARGKGTGLGLFSVAKFVDKCGGTVLCESQIGVGTTFTIIIPISKHDKQREKTSPKISKIRKEASLVFVDDESNALKIFNKYFSQIYSEVKTFSSLSELKTWPGAQYQQQIYVSDLYMPEASGLEVYTHLQHRFGKVPFILLSGNADMLRLKDFSNPGCVSIVSKPCPLSELEEIISCSLDEFYTDLNLHGDIISLSPPRLSFA